jgi:hypothetical protein
MKSLLIAATLLTASPAFAYTDTENAIILDATSYYGVAVCNPSWATRPGSIAIFSKAEAARQFTTASKALYNQGVGNFKRTAKKYGQHTACLMVDAMLQAFGG